MKVKVFTQCMQLAPSMFSFIDAQDGIVEGDLNDNAAGILAQHFGAPIKRTFQSTDTGDGVIIIGLRYKPVAVVIPEGHAKFDSKIIMCGRLPKAVK